MSSSRPIVAVLLAVCATLPSCAYLTVQQRLKPQVAEVQQTRVQLESELSRIDALLVTLEAEVDAFAAESIDWGTFDPELIRDAILDSADARIVEGKGPAEASTAAVEQLESAYAEADSETRAAAEATYALGLSIYERLQDLPDALDGVVESSGRASLKAKKVRKSAELTVAVADKSVLMSRNAHEQLDRDEVKLEAELASLDELRARIPDDVSALSERLASTLTEFVTRVDSLDGEG